MKVNNICCIGAGYVGGPTMAVIALNCPKINVTVVDSNPNKIRAWNGDLEKLPVFEPGLKEIIKKVRNKNLFFSADIDKNIDLSEMIFMAVNTPTKESGEGAGMAADLKYVEACARNIAKVAKSDKIVVEKSTLPVRTAEKIKEILDSEGNDVNFEILSNPEFLAEGTAIQDLFKSDRVLIGSDSTKTAKSAAKSLIEIYSSWIPKEKILTTNVWSSELSKLASNAMLAQRISSINSFSAICEKTGADIKELSKAIGLDRRIGPKFLEPSVGFGGSCFQKDILNLVYLCKHYGLYEVAEYWHQVVKINDYQKNRFTQKIIDNLDGEIKQKKIVILGWAFKSNSNDSRESASIYVSDKLLSLDAKVYVFDPLIKKTQVILDLKKLWKKKLLVKKDIDRMLKNLEFTNDPQETILNRTSAVAIITGWNDFKKYDWNKIINQSNNKILIFDGRNILPMKHKRILKI